MKIFLRNSIALAALTASGTLAASAAQAESLAQAVAYAYETNPALQAQRAGLRALDESYVQARGEYGLNASVAVSEASYNQNLVPGGAHTYSNNDSEILSVAQPIYTGGKVHSQLNEAEAAILAGREDLRRAEMNLLQQIVSAYVNVLRDRALLKIDQDTITVLEKETSDTEARFKVREVTMTDVAEAKARLAQAQADLANAQAALGVSTAQFVATVGQNPEDLDPPPPLDIVPATVDQAFDSAENNNPQLLAAEYTEQRSKAHIDEARAAGRPSVNAQFTLQHAPYLPYTHSPYSNAAAATITLNQPIFAGGEIASQVRQAIESNNADRLSIDDARQQVILSVSSTWEQLVAARKQLSSLSDEVAADEFSFYGNREEAKLALRSTIDVLNAELELTGAQQNLIRARATEYSTRVQLLAAMGVLTPTLLSPKVPIYDAADHLRHVQHAGETPLEWPARALDAIGQPKISPPPPASIADAKPEGSPMPPAPAPAAPIRSILSTLDKPPPEP